MLTAANELRRIRTTMVPRLVLKVASQTEFVEMQAGGALVNQTTRVVDPVVGGQVGATAVAVSGWVVGVGKVVWSSCSRSRSWSWSSTWRPCPEPHEEDDEDDQAADDARARSTRRGCGAASGSSR